MVSATEVNSSSISRGVVLLISVVSLLSGNISADPETVEGLYLTKKSLKSEEQEPKASVPSVLDQQQLLQLQKLQQQQQQQRLEEWKTEIGKPFPQAHLGGGKKKAVGGSNKEQQLPKAFGKYLQKPKWSDNNDLGQLSKSDERTHGWSGHLPLVAPQQQHRGQLPQLPEVHGWGQPSHVAPHQQQQQPLHLARMPSLQLAPLHIQSSNSLATEVPVAPPKGKNDEVDLWKLLSPPQPQAVLTVATVQPDRVKESSTAPLIQTTKAAPKNSSTSSPKEAELSSTVTIVEKKLDSSAQQQPPHAGFLKGWSEDISSNDAVSPDRQKAFLGLIIGIVFVAVFLAMGVGLAAQCAMDRVRQVQLATGGRRMGSPQEEDATPPELRGAAGMLMRHQGDGGGKMVSGSGLPFFPGKLVLHDPSSLSPPSGASGGGITRTLLAAHAAALMPSPAEQVTDDLVSPKYDEDTTEDEEEDSDDTVYECPGLAATVGGDMVVSNPFYLQGGGGGSGDLMGMMEPQQQPKPINAQSSLFHHGIKGYN